MWAVFTYGDGGYIYAMFVTMHNFFFNSSGAGPFVTMAKISASVGTLLIVWQIMLSLASRVVQVDWWWVIKYVILFNGLLVPQVPVQVIDKLDSTAAPTSTVDVPVAIGAISYFTSNIGNGLTQVYDNFIVNVPVPHLPSLPLTLAYSQAGPLFGNMFFQNMAGFKTNDYAVQNNLPLIMSECVIPLIGKDIDYNDLATSSDILKTVAPIANPGILIPGYVKLNTNPPQTIIQDCKTAVSEIDTYLDTNNSQFAQQFANRFDSGLDKAKVVDQAKMGSDLYQTMIGGATTSNSSLLKQAILINAITSGFGITSVTANSSAISQAVYTAQALAQERSTQDTTSAMVSRGLVISFAVIQCLLIAIFPVVCAMALLPFGFAVLKMYVKFTLWINLWPFLYSILTSIIFYYSAARSQSIAAYGFNFGNAADLFSFHSGVASKAAYLFGFIPPLAWILINKSEQMVTSAVSHLMSASQASGQTSGFEAAKAQFSEGNVSLDQRNLASKTTFGDSSTTHIGAGASYTNQGGVFTAQENQMQALQQFTDAHGQAATTTIALNHAQSTMMQSSDRVSQGISNTLDSAKGNASAEQFQSSINKTIQDMSQARTTSSTSQGLSDSKARMDEVGVNANNMLSGLSRSTLPALGKVVGQTAGGAIGTLAGPEGTLLGVYAGGKVGEALFEQVGKMLKADSTWQHQHKTDIAGKTDAQIGMQAMEQIASTYAHQRNYSDTASFRNTSQSISQATQEYNKSASDATTFSKIQQNQQSNSITENIAGKIMRDKYNEYMNKGYNEQQALNATVGYMESMVNQPLPSISNPNTGGARKHANLSAPEYHQYTVDDSAKSNVLNNNTTHDEVMKKYKETNQQATTRNINNTQELKNRT